MYYFSLNYHRSIGDIPVATKKMTAPKTNKSKKSVFEKKTSKPQEHTHIKSEDKTVTLSRRVKGQPDRRNNERRQKTMPVVAERRTCERRAKVNRRRQIDPTTCERDYTIAEIEFMNAIEEYKRTSGRMFPTCSEVLEVLLNLGYEKRLSPILPTLAEPTLVPDISPPLTAL
jgi:hypothetical protein